MGHGYAGCCETCDKPDPLWYIMRIGDVAITWACSEHLADACAGLQRDDWVTELSVRDGRKMREYAAINRDLDAIMEET